MDSPAAHCTIQETKSKPMFLSSIGDCHNLSLGVPLRRHLPSDLTLPFTTVQPPWPPPTSALRLPLLPNPLPTFLDKSSSFLPFHVFPNHFWKVVPSSEPFQFLLISIDHYKKLFKMIYLLFGHRSTPLECEPQESRKLILILVNSIVLTRGLPWW